MRTDDEVRADLDRLKDALAGNWRPFETWFVLYTASQSRFVPGLIWGSATSHLRPFTTRHGDHCGVECPVCYERVIGVPVAAHGDDCNADCLVCYVLTDNGLYYRHDGT